LAPSCVASARLVFSPSRLSSAACMTATRARDRRVLPPVSGARVRRRRAPRSPTPLPRRVLPLVSGARVRRRRAMRSPTTLPSRFVPPQRSCRVPSQSGNRRRSKNRITRSAVHHGTVSRREDRSRSCIYSADLRPVNTGQRTPCTKTRSLATLPIKHTARAVTRGLGLPRVFSVHQIDRSTANLETDS
jgi:hypothetical protein